jgi:hypothetical protein
MAAACAPLWFHLSRQSIFLIADVHVSSPREPLFRTQSALRHRSRKAGETLEVLDPPNDPGQPTEPKRPREQISIVGNVLGRSLSIEEMTPVQARKELVGVMDWGMAPATSVSAVIEKLLSAWGAAVGLPAFVSTTFAEITGARPCTFRQWAGDHVREFLWFVSTAA